MLLPDKAYRDIYEKLYIKIHLKLTCDTQHKNTWLRVCKYSFYEYGSQHIKNLHHLRKYMCVCTLMKILLQLLTFLVLRGRVRT